MRRSPLAASGSNGEEFEARGTRDVRRPVGLGESMAAGFAHDAPVAHCGLHLTHVGDSGLEASDRLLVWGPHPSCEAVSGLEDSMEWESTGQPIVVQASAFLSGSVGVDYGSPMELDNAAQEPIDLRGSFGEVVDDAADDCENSMEWEQTFAVVVHGPAVANELESGFLDSLSGLSLHDETAAGPEHMAAVEAAGRPGAVLEVFIHETAGQLSTMTISDPEAFLEDVDMTDAAVQQVAPIFDAETDAQISVTAVDVTHQEPSLTTLMEDAQFLDDVAPCSPRAVVDASVAAVTAPSPPGEAITYLAWESLVETMSDEEAQRWLEMEAEIDLLLSESPVPAGDALSAPVSAQGRVRVVSEAETQQVPEMVIAPEVGQERALLAIQAQEDGVTVHEDRQEVLDGGAEPPSPPERRQATEPAPSPEAPLPALPPSPIVSVPQPETPAHGDTQRPSFDTAPEPPRMGENEEDPEEEVKTDDAETVAARPKLVARGPRVASTAPHQPRQDDAEIPKDAVDAKDDEGIEPGLTPGSPPAAPEPRREPSSVETAAGEAATSQKRVDGVHPTLPDSKTTPGTGSAAAASTTPAPAPTTPRPGGLAQVPQSAEEKERMKREKLQRQANALRNRKANVFHNPKRNTAPSTAYGTRAAGSADRDRQLRSAQTLQDLNATERQPGGRGPDTTNYGPQTILVVPGAALQGRLPSEGE
ncbi:hypothetical protein G6O67_008486 [Ophiocordyceps sinensis]|nr:hypothetical protein G6O67_008486 [Ophiocordyceps sinensis]